MARKHKITQQVQRELDYIESKLTAEPYVIVGHEKMNGHEAILTGFADQVDKSDLDKEYTFRVPVVCQANHGHRLRKAYEKGGDAGVKQYLQDLYNKRVARDTIDKPMVAVKSILNTARTVLAP